MAGIVNHSEASPFCTIYSRGVGIYLSHFLKKDNYFRSPSCCNDHILDHF
jgi:hypothetical protein